MHCVKLPITSHRHDISVILHDISILFIDIQVCSTEKKNVFSYILIYPLLMFTEYFHDVSIINSPSVAPLCPEKKWTP